MVGVEVWWASLRSVHVSLVALLHATERARLERLDLPADRARSMLAAAVLRVAVGRQRDIPPRLEVDRTCADCGRPHGPPRVTGGPHVSVSHSGLLVAVALCEEASVGVDVQRVADLRAEDPVRWTRGESLVKAGGERGSTAGATTVDLAPPCPGMPRR